MQPGRPTAFEVLPAVLDGYITGEGSVVVREGHGHGHFALRSALDMDEVSRWDNGREIEVCISVQESRPTEYHREYRLVRGVLHVVFEGALRFDVVGDPWDYPACEPS